MLKILLGLALAAIGLWLLLPPLYGGFYQGLGWEAFKTVVLGLLPAILVFIGALIIWIESEDMKAKK
ncbi:MAG: hypothetical protein QXD77_00280 [Candidatus Aenigmatarchaeota archaeon]